MMEHGKPHHAALAGRHAVVTGGSRGIGLAISRSLMQAGAHVTLMARDEKRLRAAVSELQRESEDSAIERKQLVTGVRIDVADPDSVAQAFADARAQSGAIDTLVNNAGVAESAPFAKTSVEQFQRLLDINLKGVWLCTQAFAADLPAPRGGDVRTRQVVNVASTAALKGYAYVAAYCAAKHGVLGMTRALALEWARRHVTVNAVCPGYTDTDIVAEAVANITAKTGRDAAAARAELARSNPQGVLVTPAQVANAVLWLVSPGAESINGQAISVSGGEI